MSQKTLPSVWRAALVVAALAPLSLGSCRPNTDGGPGGGPGVGGSLAPPFDAGLITQRASFKGVQPQPNGESSQPRISATGRFVTFYSNASNLVADDTNGRYDVFVRNRQVDTGEAVDAPGNVATILVSREAGAIGTPGNSDSYQAVITGDGRYVAFTSYASNLVPNDTNNASDIFVRDLQNDTIARVSIASDGTEANNYAEWCDISDDGRHVVWATYATNLDPTDTNGQYDIYHHDRDFDEDGIFDDFDGNLNGGSVLTQRVSVADNGNQPNSFTYYPSISGDGRWVTFYSHANNLVDENGDLNYNDDSNNVTDIFLRDLQSTSLTRVTRSTAGVQTNGYCYTEGKAISSDGRYVTFYTYANNLVPNDTNQYEDVFVRDTQMNTTTRVSVASNGAQGNYFSVLPSISRDGRKIVFISYSTNFAPDINNTYDVFVHDMDSGQTTLMSLATSGAQASEYCYYPSVSDDGNLVAFESYASNLIPGDTNNRADCFLRNQTGPTTIRVSEGGSNEPGANSSAASISKDGNLIVFQTDATDIVANDGNFASDIFLRSLSAGANGRVSVANGGVEASGGGSFHARISPDGRFVAFDSLATNLDVVIPDNNGASDIFVRSLYSTVRVSLTNAGTQATGGHSFNPSITPDGRFVVFESDATNIVADGNASRDIFVRDRDFDGNGIFDETLLLPAVGTRTVRVSLTAAGGEANGGSFNGSISDDGRFVAFQSNAFNLVANDGNGVSDIFVMDRDFDGNGIYDELGATTTFRVSVEDPSDPDGNPADFDNATGGASINPVISGNGNFVVFESGAFDLVIGDNNNATDIFRRNILSSTTVRVSVGAGGEANNSSGSPVISADGRYVAFHSTADNLTANDQTQLDVFLRDITAGTTVKISVNADGSDNGNANGDSGGAAISVDGRFVVFQSFARNLTSPAEGSGQLDVYRRGPLN